MSNTDSLAWDDVVKKEARGIDDDVDLGEVQEIGSNWILTQKGVADKTRFYIPKYLVRGYDGSTLWFNVSQSQLAQFARDAPPTNTDYTRYRTAQTPANVEQRIPLIEERMNVAKTVSTQEARITKEPVTETRTMDVPVTHEELRVERRPASGQAAREGPISEESEVRIPLNREEVNVSKTPVVREEVVVKKVPVTETRRVSQEVTSERLKDTQVANATTDEDEQ